MSGVWSRNAKQARTGLTRAPACLSPVGDTTAGHGASPTDMAYVKQGRYSCAIRRTPLLKKPPVQTLSTSNMPSARRD
jgi:hypothetical protein